jgi:hypothetical protein
MNTSRLLFILPLFIVYHLLPQTLHGQFREIYRGTDSTNHITGMSFLSPSTGYVAFSKFIGYTQDSGRTYIRRYISYTNTDFNGYAVGLTLGFSPAGVVAFSSDSLLAYGDFSFEPSILFSANGGQTWKLVYHLNANFNAPAFSEGITDIEFPGNGPVGYAIHHEGIVKTTNRGQSWIPVYNTPNQLLRKLSCPSQNLVYASGGSKVYMSTNGGTAWSSIAPTVTSSNPSFNNIFFVSDNTGYCTENNAFQIYKTVNGGLAWTKMNDETIISVGGNDLYFINDSTGFMASNLYEVVKTSDNGKTWELCKRENSYQYKFYGLNALHFLNKTTGWAGGDGEYLLLSTDGGQATIPAAYFKIDQSTVATNNTVNLINYSKPGYNYSWSKNGKFLSNTYNTSYLHAAGVLRDTIQLIVWNANGADTMVQYADFSAPMTITGFTPEVGYYGVQIMIYGVDFSDIKSVTFGGVPALSFYQYNSTKLQATVGNGASGEVRVANANTSAAKNGFVYLADPKTNLPVSVQDTILCKSEPIVITIKNTEPDVRYELMDANNVSYGSAKGTGGDLLFTSNPISTTGTYSIYAIRSYLTTSVKKKLATAIGITVEHPLSVFSADKINAAPGEAVNFVSYSVEASSYAWTFSGDASISGSASQAPANITYASAGQKSATLIAISNNGCKDTLTKEVVYIYNKPATEDVCYANNTADEDNYYVTGSLNDLTLISNDGYLICGAGTNPILKSRYGSNSKIKAVSVSHVAAYTRDGILKWYDYVGDGGRINAAVKDNSGNIYIAGYCGAATLFHFNNGDSMTFVPKTATSHPAYSKLNGFVLKIDSTGKYIWHTLLYDPTGIYQGYTVQGGLPVRMKLQGDQLIIIGSCIANLSYYQNGVITPIMASQNGVPNDNQNNFILSINTNGVYKWSSYAHNVATNQRRAFSDIGMDASGNVYVTGYRENSVDIYDAFNKKTVLNGALGYAFGYILKYDQQGRLLWNMNMSNNHSQINACTVEPSGFIYVTGSSKCKDSTVYFLINNADGTTQKASYAGYFIIKASPDGKAIWTQGSRYSYYGSGYTVYSDGKNVYTTGMVSNNGIRYSSFTFTSAGGDVKNFPIYESEFFLAKYDTSGVLMKINTSGENFGGHVTPARLIIDSKKQFVIGGVADNWNGGNSKFTLFRDSIATNSIDAFYTKLDADFCSAATTTVYPMAGKDTIVCAGSPVQLGSANANGYHYSWSSKPAGFSASTPSVTVAPVATTTYFISLLNSSGIVTRDTVVVTVNNPLANAGADKSICAGGKDSIGVPGTGATYFWTSQPAGFTSQVPNPVVAPSVTTQYFLAVQNTMGCKSADTVVVTVKPVPAKPMISAGLNDSVVSSATTGNQWYIDTTTLIANATGRSYKPNANGYYSVQATVNGCVSPFADKYDYKAQTVTAVGGPNGTESMIRIAPNPARQFITINFKIWGIRQLNMEIYDDRGRKVLAQKNITDGAEVSIANLLQGIYMIKLYDDKNKINTVKQLFKY